MKKMKKSINKGLKVVLMLSAGLYAQVAFATQIIKIESQGNMKFLVASETSSDFIVKIYNEENEIIHQEAIGSKKIFNLTNLIDGNYKMEVYDAKKNLVSKKSFQIKTEIKRDLIAQS
jgi:hypothetical protein